MFLISCGGCSCKVDSWAAVERHPQRGDAGFRVYEWVVSLGWCEC